MLDAGCGTGWFSQHWQQAGNHVTALDLSTDMLQQAQSQQTATVYSQGDIEALPFGDGQFDLSWSNWRCSGAVTCSRRCASCIA